MRINSLPKILFTQTDEILRTDKITRINRHYTAKNRQNQIFQVKAVFKMCSKFSNKLRYSCPVFRF